MIEAHRINSLFDADVVDADGSRIGTVKHVYVDPEGGQPLFAGVATIAWWVAARSPRFAPRTKGGVTAWFGVALSGTAFASVAYAPVAAVGGPSVGFILVVLPSGVSVVLAAIWTTRLIGEFVDLR